MRMHRLTRLASGSLKAEALNAASTSSNWRMNCVPLCSIGAVLPLLAVCVAEIERSSIVPRLPRLPRLPILPRLPRVEVDEVAKVMVGFS